MNDEGPWRAAAAQAGLLDAAGDAAPTIFAEMTELAGRTGAINLGQGFPDEDAPPELLAAAGAAIAAGHNQYAPGRGVPELRRAIAQWQRRWQGRQVDPDREVLVTAGATEALAATILAFVAPGDEILVLEPYYDQYAALAGLVGARLVTVALEPAGAGFALDPERLRAAASDRTRLILVNTPHNPTGAVLDAATLGELVAVAERHDALLVTDEVYEQLAFDRPHLSLATLPGARDRTVTISSAGKTFSVTGWKIGWVVAPARLITAILAVKQFLTFTSGTPFQYAVALGLGLPDAVFADRRASLAARRDLLAAALDDAGFATLRPQAGYFVCADAGPLGAADAAAFARTLAVEAGVVSIPVAAFCRPGGEQARRFASWLRFAYCKHPATLGEAAERLRRWSKTTTPGDR